MYIKKCELCGKEKDFKYKSWFEKKKFCSSECYHASTKGREAHNLIRSASLFEGGLNEFNVYVLGLIYSDGHFFEKKGRWYINLAMNEPTLIPALHKIICPEKALSEYTHPKGNAATYSFHYHNEYDVQFLHQLGLVQQKSDKIRFPELPDELKRHFVRGFFDGDGCVYINKTTRRTQNFCKTYEYPHVTFTTGSIEFAYDLASVLSINNIDASVVHDSRKSSTCHYTKIYKANSVRKLYNWMYLNTTWFLDRKHNTYSKVI